MNFNTFYNKILTDENMMETIRHSTSAYPFRFYYDNFSFDDEDDDDNVYDIQRYSDEPVTPHHHKDKQV